MRFKQNKTGHIFPGRVEEIAENINHALMKFQTSKAENKRHKDVIYAIDTTGETIRIPIFVEISIEQKKEWDIDAYFCPSGAPSDAEQDFVGSIWIQAKVAKAYKKKPRSAVTFFPALVNRSTIIRILNHEIGHALRESELSKKMYEAKYKHKATKKYRATPEYILEHPTEFDAFMNEIIFYYRDGSPYDWRFETYNDLFNEVIPLHVSKKAAKELQKPQWRQKIIKRLLREGIVLQR